MWSFPEPEYEQVLTASWTLGESVQVASSDLPDPWRNALHRLGRDLHVRHYAGTIDRIDWVARYDALNGGVMLLSSVTVAGRGPDGLGMSGCVPQLVDDEETILACIADLIQDQVARAHVAWPWRDTGGFMSAELHEGRAVWSDNGRRIAIGQLKPK
ncbi:hypothetical protein [Williamsia sp. 1135]|uniref:hypothetical protein n=1 Tax=Williamsia sp. 1135 TaxID=1889262 RepID=UPI000A11F072|nr:hypothetical protein [Williamsia sp. 1135]ORM32783.1 hypothetical protein BFL43_14795 [Williamsia sp. 1135]